jgi:hypothetical protein
MDNKDSIGQVSIIVVRTLICLGYFAAEMSSTTHPRKLLKTLVPEEGIEPSWTQGPRDFEFSGGGGQEDTTAYS